MSKRRNIQEKRAKKNKKRINQKRKKQKKLEVVRQFQTAQSSGVKSKFSETLLEFAKPLIAAAHDIDQERTAIELSIFVWNILLLHPSKKEAVEQAKEIMKEPTIGFNYLLSNFDEIVDLLYDRKKQYFDNDKRIAMDYSLDQIDDGFYLQVASGVK